MSEENSNFDDFNERFETVEQALKYIADSQAKSEWIRKKDVDEIRQLQLKTQQQLDHITKLTGIVFDDLNAAGEKFDEIGKVLRKK